MTTYWKTTDPSADPFSAAVSFTSAEFNEGDFLDIKKSMRKSGSTCTISCASDATITVRINSLQQRFPINVELANRGLSVPDLTAGAEWTDTSAPSFLVESSVDMVIDTLPIANIEIVSLTKGAGTGVAISVH